MGNDLSGYWVVVERLGDDGASYSGEFGPFSQWEAAERFLTAKAGADSVMIAGKIVLRSRPGPRTRLTAR